MLGVAFCQNDQLMDALPGMGRALMGLMWGVHIPGASHLSIQPYITC